MAHPNLFIVGAPKCGTTSLYGWLSEHPNVFLSKPKEPHFFAEQRYRNVTTLSEYKALFKDAKPEHKIVGEASATYLHSPGALEKVKEFAPDAKIVIMVRNPVDLVQSMYGHLKFRQQEDIETFDEAWRVSPSREKGQKFPKMAKEGDPVQLTYTTMGILGENVRRALSLFPKENVHIVVFDDFKVDAKGEYQKVLAFLGLPDDGRTNFEAANVTRSHGKSRLSKIVQGLPRPVVRFARKLGLADRGMVTNVSNKFTEKEKRAPLDPALKREIEDYYREDVQLLSDLLGRDLTKAWLDKA